MTQSILDDISKAAWQRNNPAYAIMESLSQHIIEFEGKLNSGEEIAALLTSSPNSTIFYIATIAAIGPEVLIFEGIDENKRPVKLIQHYSQLSVMLTSLPKVSDQPRRIGFDIAKAVHDQQK